MKCLDGLCVIMALAALSLNADWRVGDCEYRLALPTNADSERAVFFVDFNDVERQTGKTASTESFRLFSETGAALPFSLDYRYGAETPGKRFVGDRWRPLGDKSPVFERKLRRLGYLSFEKRPGEGIHYLYFNVSGDSGALVPSANPRLRPWWIDVVADPTAHKDGKPGLYRCPQGGWNISREGVELNRPEGGTILTEPGALNVDSRAADRRVVFYLQLRMDKAVPGANVFYLPLPNAYPGTRDAVAWWVGGFSPGLWEELSVEGKVARGFNGLEPGARATFSLAGPCAMTELHVQFPPEERSIGECVEFDSDVFYVGDKIKISFLNAKGLALLRTPLVLSAKTPHEFNVKGERLSGDKMVTLTAELHKDGTGKLVSITSGEIAPGSKWVGEISLKGVVPGKYVLRLEVAGFREEVPIRVEAYPFEESK